MLMFIHRRRRFSKIRAVAVLILAASSFAAQQPPASDGAARKASRGNPKDTEVWQPEPKIITPGAKDSAPPSDAQSPSVSNPPQHSTPSDAVEPPKTSGESQNNDDT